MWKEAMLTRFEQKEVRLIIYERFKVNISKVLYGIGLCMLFPGVIYAQSGNEEEQADATVYRVGLLVR